MDYFNLKQPWNDDIMLLPLSNSNGNNLHNRESFSKGKNQADDDFNVDDEDIPLYDRM